MNDAQKQIYNMMIDSLEKGSKVIFIMPRKAGRTTIRKAVQKHVRKVHQHRSFGYGSGCECE